MSSANPVRWEKSLTSGNEYLIEAVQIRRERTGVHAKVGLFLSNRLLGANNFNVERSDERIRLANQAHEGLPTVDQADYPKLHLRHDLDIFCLTLWQQYLEPLIATPVNGDSTSHPVEYLAEPFVIAGGGTIMFAPPGAGKSCTALLMAVSMDAGVSVLWPSKQKRVLFVNLERSALSVQRRLGCVNTALGLDPARPLLIQNARGKSLQDVRDITERSIQEHHVDVVVLDSISRAGMGDLNENRPVNAIIDTLNGLADTWLALAHTPRADASHAYGGIHFDAGADIMLQLLSSVAATSLGIGLRVTKANDIPKPPMKVYKYEFDDYGLTSAYPAHLADYPALAEGIQLGLADEMHAYLTNETGQATASQIAQELKKSRGHVVMTLRSDKRFSSRKEGREVFYSVPSSRAFPDL